ncbi:MAG: hypothetical protein ABGX17_08535 [Desulfurobacteriaceae bacterium]
MRKERITQREAKERIKELLQSQPTLKKIVEEEGWEGLEGYSEDPTVQELLEWGAYV